MRAPHMEVGPEWHDEVLAANWDGVVGKNDVVWVLGDLCLSGTAVTNNALDWVKSRPGRKHLISGNHDNCFPGTNRDFAKWMPRYLEVFETVQPFARKKIAGKNVLMSHFPYSGDHTVTERFTQWRLPDMGEWLLHGHTHTAEKIRGKMIHVGVDAHNFTPVSMEKIFRMVSSTEEMH